jgi:predicted phosphodiesterase
MKPMSLQRWLTSVIVGMVVLGVLTGCARAGGSIGAEYPKVSATTNPPATSTVTLQSSVHTPSLTPTLEPSIPSPDYDPSESLGTFIIPLTIQHVSETSAQLYFMLEAPAEGVVYYTRQGDADAQPRWIPFSAEEEAHIITLRGMEPGAAYEVWVGIADEIGVHHPPSFADATWESITVQLPREDEWPIRIGVIGDSGFGEAVTFQLAEEMASHQPDFFIHTGDLVYSAYQEPSPAEAFIRKYYQAMRKPLQVGPIYPVFGNHEGYADVFWRDQPFYYFAFPPLENDRRGEDFVGISGERDWYAFTRGGYQFIFLNSQRFYMSTLRMEQNAWLEDRLDEYSSLTTIAIFHVPPFTSGHHRDDGIPIQQSWLPLFEESNVAMVLSGHDHNFERLERKGISYIVPGGGSSSLYHLEETREESEFFVAQSHFVLLELFPDRIELSAYGLGGELLESYTHTISVSK